MSVRVRITVVRIAVERRVVGEVNDLVSSCELDGRSDLRVEMVFDVLVWRVEAVSWASSRRVERVEGSEEEVEEDHGLYHGIVESVGDHVHLALTELVVLIVVG